MAGNVIEDFLTMVAKNETQISTRRDHDINVDIEQLDDVARAAAGHGVNPAQKVNEYRKLAMDRVRDRIKFYDQVLQLLRKPPKS